MIANADSIRIPLADGVVQCVVTSPPYWGLRAYSGEQERVWGGAVDCEHEWGAEQRGRQHGRNDTNDPTSTNFGGWGNWDGATGDSAGNFCQRCGAWRGGLGLEPTPELFIEHMVQVFREVRRVMRDDAVAWVNMGDCFNDKQLVMMPHRLALALQADGWWVRSDVVWAKPNPMPESISGWRWEQCKGKATDDWQPCTGCPKCATNDGLVLRRGSWRPTNSHEYVFMLAKSATYFSDGEAVREKSKPESIERMKTGWHGNEYRDYVGGKQNHISKYMGTERAMAAALAGRNLRDVWNIATQPYPGAHFATFPTALAQRCVLASTSRHACAECGAPHVRVVETTRSYDHVTTDAGKSKTGPYASQTGDGDGTHDIRHGVYSHTATLAHRPSCGCGAGVRPCIVLDPFCGSGTVGQVCRELPHKRRFVGLDLSFDYLRDQALVRSERRTPASKLAELPMFT